MDALVIEKLEKLGSLLEKGILTREEFDAQKALLLAPQAPPAPVAAAPPTVPTPAPAVVQVVAPSPVPSTAPVAAPPPEPQPVVGEVAAKKGAPAGYWNADRVILAIVLVPCVFLAAPVLLFVGWGIVEGLGDNRPTAQAAAPPTYEEPAAPAPTRRAPKKQARFTATPVRCDDRCAGLFDDCTYVECLVTNIGNEAGSAEIDLTVGSRTENDYAFIEEGSSHTSKAEFKGVTGATCACAAVEDTEAIGE